MRLIPDRVRLADAGVSARTLATTVDAFNDGLRVAEITVGGSRLDLTLLGPKPDGERTQSIASLPVVTSSGQILPASSLASIEVTEGPNEILHLERERTVTLEIRPANDLPLESALEILQRDVVEALRAQGLPPGVKVNLAGTADQLTQTWDAMVVNLALAIVIVYLVMAVLFESFVYPLIIMVSVPVAAAGGVGGLALLNLYQYQALDMLTLLGFVILVGIVVNNAILLVHQTLHLIRDQGMGHRHGDPGGHAQPPAPDLHEHAHLGVRHAAAGDLPGCRLRALSRPRLGGDRRALALGLAHPPPDPAHAQPVHEAPTGAWR